MLGSFFVAKFIKGERLSVSTTPCFLAANRYDGSIKQNYVYDAVVDVYIPDKDVQQCADVIMHLHFFYSIKAYEYISFILWIIYKQFISLHCLLWIKYK